MLELPVDADAATDDEDGEDGLDDRLEGRLVDEDDAVEDGEVRRFLVSCVVVEACDDLDQVVIGAVAVVGAVLESARLVASVGLAEGLGLVAVPLAVDVGGVGVVAGVVVVVVVVAAVAVVAVVVRASVVAVGVEAGSVWEGAVVAAVGMEGDKELETRFVAELVVADRVVDD